MQQNFAEINIFCMWHRDSDILNKGSHQILGCVNRLYLGYSIMIIFLSSYDSFIISKVSEIIHLKWTILLYKKLNTFTMAYIPASPTRTFISYLCLVLGIFNNLLLLHLIRRHSRSDIGYYKFILSAFAVYEIIFSIIDFMVSPVSFF